jgi:ribosome-associated toxin RatA of RatAB toxin-antitoxin module
MVDTSISAVVRVEPRRLYALAAAVEDWPRLLPHYRWVRVLAADGPNRRTVEMAARRDIVGPLSIPLWWTAVQTLDPENTTIGFEHIQGITRGMQVTWRIEPLRDEGRSQAIVVIRHVFEPHWPVPEAMIRAVIGEYFVNGVARRTLTGLGGPVPTTVLTHRPRMPH